MRVITSLSLLFMGVVFCGLAAWLVHQLVFAERIDISGTVIETGSEYNSVGRGSHHRILFTIEGHPFVFYRKVGWFDGREAMLADVRTGVPATVSVLAGDLEDEQGKEPADRRVDAWGLDLGGETVFSVWAKAAVHLIFIVPLGFFGVLTLVGSLAPFLGAGARQPDKETK